MKKEIEIVIPPKFINDYNYLHQIVAKKLHLADEDISAVQVVRRSIDARMKNPIYRIKVNVYVNEKPIDLYQKVDFKPLQTDKKVIVVGFGPAGMFASLKLIELGVKPIVFERGKDVQARRKDLRAIQQEGIVNPDSNYCFGEGGAGTYSDGKLYTRSTKRGNVNRILSILVQHGAQPEILLDAHPHIGSNKLPKVVTSIRNTIQNCGGEVHFNSKVTDLIISNKTIIGVVINNDQEFYADAVILAVGHSARDIYYLLHKKNIKLEIKPFAMGVRIEHPQALIDEIQYHSKIRDVNLPSSSYDLACQIDGKGVYSFCMCPGGIIIPASTSSDELVLNGMSVSKRNSQFANSGLVVSIDEKDWIDYLEYGVFAGLEFQKYVEKLAFESGGKNQKAPAQRITDFVNSKISSSLPKTSYIPGTTSAPLHELLPPSIVIYLKKSLLEFNKKMKGYYTEEAQILAAESRTSSPIRILRDHNTLMHLEVEGLFPSGEGAGYAGGIVSAAIDGERCAEGALNYIFK